MASKLENLIVIGGLCFVGVLVAQTYVRHGTEPMFDPGKLGDLFQPVRQFFGTEMGGNDADARQKRQIQRFAEQAGASWDDVGNAMQEDLKAGFFTNADGESGSGASGHFANAGGPQGAVYTMIDGEPYWNTGNGR
ncbi:hypothetical protein OL229_05165 [Neisseriaceae bacterium JH1-16]|nr:hypothetical protein [Neisseriaceae bacterium JH1-16]